jgi:hypothetical protein
MVAPVRCCIRIQGNSPLDAAMPLSHLIDICCKAYPLQSPARKAALASLLQVPCRQQARAVGADTQLADRPHIWDASQCEACTAYTNCSLAYICLAVCGEHNTTATLPTGYTTKACVTKQHAFTGCTNPCNLQTCCQLTASSAAVAARLMGAAHVLTCSTAGAEASPHFGELQRPSRAMRPNQFSKHLCNLGRE